MAEWLQERTNDMEYNHQDLLKPMRARYLSLWSTQGQSKDWPPAALQQTWMKHFATHWLVFPPTFAVVPSNCGIIGGVSAGVSCTPNSPPLVSFPLTGVTFAGGGATNGDGTGATAYVSTRGAGALSIRGDPISDGAVAVVLHVIPPGTTVSCEDNRVLTSSSSSSNTSSSSSLSVS
jgi:hypothetical protein